MNRNLIRYSSLVLLIIALGPITRTLAQTEQTRQITTIHDMGPVGFAFGQSLRINVRNSLTPSSREDRRSFKMLVAPLILDLHGNVIAQSSQITLLPNESHTFEFKRDALPLTGDPITGRVQVHTDTRITFRDLNINVAELTPPSLEIIDDSTGKTTIGFPSGVRVGSADVDAAGQNGNSLIAVGMLGVVRDQTLRISIFNPTTRMIDGSVRFFDGSGVLIAQSPGLSIPPGEFRFFDLNRDCLPLTGETGTDRVQMATNIFLKVETAETREPAVSIEVIDNLTGTTTTLLLPAIQQIRQINVASGN